MKQDNYDITIDELVNGSIWVGLYICAIVIVNVGFSYVPLFDTPFGTFSPMAAVVGAIFVIRDFAQRKVGHYILLTMLVGIFISYELAVPVVALASAVSFALSELTDWAFYTFTKKPFYQRILISSALSTPVDTAVFLYMIDYMTVGTFVLMVISKLLAALVVYFYHRKATGNDYARDEV